MSSQTAVAIFAGEANVDKVNFIEELSIQRKKKNYTYNPISIKVIAGGLIDNADTIKQGIALMRLRADEAIKNELTVETLELLKKEFSEVHEWLKATRTSVTGEFDKVKLKYTENEKSLKYGIIADIDAQILKMKEKTFQIAEANIKKHLEELIEKNKDLGIGLNIFDSFIAEKRKTAGMLPNEKTGNTGAGALRTIQDEFEKIAKPIREAKELDNRKSMQSKQFEHSLDAINIDGENIEYGIESLFKLEQTVDDIFPDIAEACKRSIKNKIEKAEANIRAKKVMQERDEANAMLNAIKSHDDGMMERVSIIKTGITTDSIEVLEDKLQKLREIHSSLKDDDNKKKTVDIANSIKAIISDMQVENMKPDTNSIMQYGISDEALDCIMFELQMIEVDAEDVSDARAKIITAFAEFFETDFIKVY